MPALAGEGAAVTLPDRAVTAIVIGERRQWRRVSAMLSRVRLAALAARGVASLALVAGVSLGSS